MNDANVGHLCLLVAVVAAECRPSAPPNFKVTLYALVANADMATARHKYVGWTVAADVALQGFLHVVS